MPPDNGSGFSLVVSPSQSLQCSCGAQVIPGLRQIPTLQCELICIFQPLFVLGLGCHMTLSDPNRNEAPDPLGNRRWSHIYAWFLSASPGVWEMELCEVTM